jgi:predicted Na+-dependent transporter
MYQATVVLLMFLLPIVGVAIDIQEGHYPIAESVIKWFVLWAVGVRLLLAGVRQITQPAFTQRILGLKSDETRMLIRELGFANAALGTIAIASYFFGAWRAPAAVAGALFYLMAGVNHLLEKHRNRLQNLAMISDLFVGIVLATACILRVALIELS